MPILETSSGRCGDLAKSLLERIWPVIGGPSYNPHTLLG